MSKSDGKKKPMSKVLKVILVGVGALILLVIAIALSGGTKDTADNRADAVMQGARDNLAMASVRAQVAQSAVDGKGKINEYACNNVKKAVRNFNADADWFSRCTGAFYVDLKDTDQRNIMTISDDERCAVITTGESSEIIDYQFKDEPCKGYRMFFEEYTPES